MKITMVYEHSLRAWLDGKRLIANRGGTRSGKTYSLVCLLVSIARNGKKRSIDIVSESLPHLKRGAINDIEDILTNEGMMEGVHYEHNRSDHTYTFNKGTQIRFFSADDWGKVKGSRRNILFINESNRIPFETYRQLAVRTTETIFLDWNPDTEYWYEMKGLNTKDTTTEIVSTYKDNPFLSEVQIEEIESNKGDEAWWKVYGLGEVGRPMGVIFDRWEQVESIPEEATLVGRGLDFGFMTDPTAMVDVYKYDGKLWLDEVCYRHGMTNDKIASELKGFRGRTVADSAEMKSITEIYNYGIRYIEPAKKGADSVRAGIDVLRRYEMMVTKRSLNLIYELRNYKWKENRLTGETMNEPVDKWNHCLDAARYIALNYLAERPKTVRPKGKLPETC